MPGLPKSEKSETLGMKHAFARMTMRWDAREAPAFTSRDVMINSERRSLRIRRTTLLICLVLPGCSRLTIKETHDEGGFPIRMELVDPDERDDDLVRMRRDSYRGKTRGAAPIDVASSMRMYGLSHIEFDPFEERGCAPEGEAEEEGKVRENRLKNWIALPEPLDIDPHVTLEAMRAPGADVNRWDSDKAATIEGYVRNVWGGWIESCNCSAIARGLTDTHLDIVSFADDSQRPVIAEINPTMRLIHKQLNLEDWSSMALRSKYKGKRVRITGWLFYDWGHYLESDTVDPANRKGGRNWRATAWEIHPITSIEIIDD